MEKKILEILTGHKTNWTIQKETDEAYSLMRTRKKRDVFNKVAHLSIEITSESLKKRSIIVPFHQMTFRQAYEEKDIDHRIIAYREMPNSSFHLVWSEEGYGYLIKGCDVIDSELKWTNDHSNEDGWLLAYNVRRGFCNIVEKDDDLIGMMLKLKYGVREYEKGIESGVFK